MNRARDTVEVWSRNGYTTTSCYFPSIPEKRYGGTINGFKYCGGGDNWESQTSCIEFSDGTWNKSNINLYGGQRWAHTSWETNNGIYLMGGGEATGNWKKTTLVKADGSSTNGFSLPKKNV